MEQKTGAIARRLVGYGRFEGPALLATLFAAASAAHEPVPANVQAAREGSRRRLGDEALAPARHSNPSGHLGVGTARCREHGPYRWPRTRADPIIALTAICAAHAELGRDQRRVAPVSKELPIVVDFAASVAGPRGTASAERSIAGPTGRWSRSRGVRHCSIRYRADIEDSLEASDHGGRDAGPAEAGHSDRLTDNHLRATERMVKSWRALQVKMIIRSATTALVLTPRRPSGCACSNFALAFDSIFG